MYLEIIKEISDEGANKLKKAKAEEQALLKLIDADLFRNDLANYEKDDQNKNESIKSIKKEIGEFVHPEFGIVENFFSGYSYRRLLAKEKKETLFLYLEENIGVHENSLCLTNGKELNFEFLCGAFSPRNKDISSSIHDGMVFRIASYFHDKQNLYSAIFKNLLKNKEEYIKYSTKEFVEDIISLFSANYSFESISDFCISPLEKRKIFLEKPEIKREWLYIGRELFYPKDEMRNYWQEPELKTDLWLNGNKLILITSWGGRTECYNKTFKEKINQPEFNQFSEENLQDWLKHIVLTSNLGMAICRKIDSKILLSNI